jgi:hypothetical protein
MRVKDTRDANTSPCHAPELRWDFLLQPVCLIICDASEKSDKTVKTTRVAVKSRYIPASALNSEARGFGAAQQFVEQYRLVCR